MDIKVYRGLPLLEMILTKIKISDGCWEWQGLKERDGYPHIKYKGKMIRVHRYIYEATYGKLGKLHILHRCDNPSCVRPSHLRSGTPLDNARDMIEKGRHPFSHFMNAETVLNIRRDYANSDKKRGIGIKIAKKYGLKPHITRAIIRGDRWGWLK